MNYCLDIILCLIIFAFFNFLTCRCCLIGLAGDEDGEKAKWGELRITFEVIKAISPFFATVFAIDFILSTFAAYYTTD